MTVSTPMKALTIWQPWASLIMIGAKPYEFRERRSGQAVRRLAVDRWGLAK
jgi:hypothetical protein